MSTGLLQRMYNISPQGIQTMMLNAYALKVHSERYGAKFRDIQAELNRTQYFNPKQIDDYQNTRLKRLIHHAYSTVPYYRELFNRIRLKPEDIKTKNDLSKIPVLTRDDVRTNLPKLLSTAFKQRDLVLGHTSGTTGSPLEFYWDINTCVYTNGVDWRQKQWAGVKYGDPIAVLLGRMIVPTSSTKPPFWRMNYLHNQLWFSSFHMTIENLKHYLDKLIKFKPAAIEGYPSTVYILARYMVANGFSLPLTAVFTSSETLYPVQREVIEKAFGCKVFDFYGLAERVLFATECEAHSGRHLNFEYGLTEIVDGTDHPVKNGKMGVVVSTSLQNLGMPFIRYKTSDVSQIRNQFCSCGRHMLLLDDITTKAEDIVVTPDGRMISPSVLTHPFKPMHNIEKSQIIQEEMNHIIIKIVKRPGYSENDTQTLLASFKERVGNDMDIMIEFVDDIPTTKSGKFRWVISKVPLTV
jgi:phenylacetate-CoA ligase